MIKHISGICQFNSEIIDYKTSIEVTNGKRVTTKDFLIQINDKSSDWVSDVKIYYNDDEDLDILDAAVVDFYGEELRKLKKKEITTRSSISNFSLFEDDLVKTFQLKWDKYPYRIRYKYRITTSQFVYLANWYPMIDTDISVRQASLTVKVPGNYEIKIDATDSISYSKNSDDDQILHTWTSTNLPSFNVEDYSPHLNEVMPYVKVVPRYFTYGVKGSFDSWKSYGEWITSLNGGLLDLPEYEKRKVDELIEGVSDPTKKIETLYRYLQESTRYINVAIDEGGLKPYPASYVCEKRYGDCKALTIYMQALLRYAGIDSYYTTIFAGDKPNNLAEHFPSQQFNHVILAIPIEEDTIWLENTSSTVPAGYMGTFTQSRKALLVNGSESSLVDIPALDYGSVLESRRIEYSFVKDSSNFTMHCEYLGDKSETFKYVNSIGDNERLKVLLERQIPIEKYTLLDWEIKECSELKTCLDINLINAKVYRELGGRRVVNIPEIDIPELKKTDNRMMPIRINYPINRVDSVIFYLASADYSVKLPENVNIQSRFGSYKETYLIKDKDVLVSRHFMLTGGDFDVANYQEFYEFLDGIKSSLRKSLIILNPKS